MRTLELRWFVDAELSDHELRAFAGDGQIERRTDEYLLGTGDDLGVKRRGAAGLLEYKHRLAHIPIVIALESGSIGGLVELWDKRWPDPSKPLEDRAGWLAVAKRRAVRDLGEFRAELTGLHVRGSKPQHSLAIETREELGSDALGRAAGVFLTGYPARIAGLAGAHACGYPEWLGFVSKKNA